MSYFNFPKMFMKPKKEKVHENPFAYATAHRTPEEEEEAMREFIKFSEIMRLSSHALDEKWGQKVKEDNERYLQD